MTELQQQQHHGAFLGFMTTIPGILTAFAAVVTAAGGIYLGMHTGGGGPVTVSMNLPSASSAPPSPVQTVDPHSLRSTSADDLASTDPVQPLLDECAAGDDAACAELLDTLSQECADGALLSCDVLYELSPAGSTYEAYGATCGGRWLTEDYADTCSEQ